MDFVLLDESCKAHFISSYVVKNAPAVDGVRDVRLENPTGFLLSR